MSKPKRKTSFLRPIHFEALIFVIIYFLLSAFVVVKAVSNPNTCVSFLAALCFGVVSVFLFLYLFSHKDFFHFFKNLEEFEDKKEDQYLRDFKRYGKYLACVLIGIVGGQIFLALSVRFLFPKSANRYLIALVITLINTTVVVFFGKGIFHFLGLNFL